MTVSEFLGEFGAEAASTTDADLELLIAIDTGTRIIMARPTIVRFEHSTGKAVIEAEVTARREDD